MSDKDKSDERLIDELTNKTRELKQDIYVYEKLHAQLINAKKEWEQTFDAIPDIVMVIDNQHNIVKANKTLSEKLGIKREQLIGKKCYEVMHRTSEPPQYCSHQKTIESGEERFIEIFEKSLNGFFIFSTTPVYDENGICAGIVEVGRDITERKQAAGALEKSETQVKAISDSSLDAIIVIDGKGEITYFNPAAERMFGFTAVEALGRKLHDFLVSEKAKKEYYHRLPQFEETGQCGVVGKVLEVTATRKDCTTLPVEISISTFQLNGVWHSAGAIRDISRRKLMEEKLIRASITDELTGLLNRRGFFALAEKQFEIAKRNKRNFTILYMDLNDMKSINDKFGHQEGDQALIDISGILKKTFRASDIIARTGGDEFIVFIVDPKRENIEKIISKNILHNLTAHNEKIKLPYKLSISTGFSHFDPEHPSSIDKLIAEADALMYEDKKRKTN